MSDSPASPTLSDRWVRQEVASRNVWLRSMSIRLEFEQGQLRLDLGDIFGLTEQMDASGPVADWQEVLTAMRDNDIAGMELNGDEIEFTSAKGQRLREPLRVTDAD